MRETGIVRQIDTMGRICPPINLRRQIDCEQQSLVELTVEGSYIIVKKAHTRCFLCGQKDDLAIVDDLCLCRQCIKRFEAEKGEVEK